MYKAISREDLLGVHHCSESLRGARGKDSDGCKWTTGDYEGVCPFRYIFCQLKYFLYTEIFSIYSNVFLSYFSNDDDTEAEIEFRFQVPRLPDAASETKFR